MSRSAARASVFRDVRRAWECRLRFDDDRLFGSGGWAMGCVCVWERSRQCRVRERAKMRSELSQVSGWTGTGKGNLGRIRQVYICGLRLRERNQEQGNGREKEREKVVLQGGVVLGEVKQLVCGNLMNWGGWENGEMASGKRKWNDEWRVTFGAIPCWT